MTVEAVVFDIGNVLVEWRPEAFYDAAIGADRRARLFAEVPLAAMNESVDLGRPLGDAVAELAARHPDWAAEIGFWDSRWLEMFAPVIPGSVAALAALKAKGEPVFALTNFGNETLARADAAYPFLTGFDRRFVSGELRLMKPDAAIYATVEEGTGLAPDRLLFADDKAENVAAAAARGWRTHLFEGSAGWADRLLAEGLLTEEEAGPCR